MKSVQKKRIKMSHFFFKRKRVSKKAMSKGSKITTNVFHSSFSWKIIF